MRTFCFTAVVTVFFSSSHICRSCRLDVYHTSIHDVALVQIRMKCAARSLLKIQDAKIMQKIAICFLQSLFYEYTLTTVIPTEIFKVRYHHWSYRQQHFNLPISILTEAYAFLIDRLTHKGGDDPPFSYSDSRMPYQTEYVSVL